MAELDTQLASVAALKGSLDQLGGRFSTGPVIIGLAALAAWGAVTFIAVKLAIVSAAKVTRTHP